MNEFKTAPKTSREALAAFASGMLFSVGLAVAGMTQPSKVKAFLDFTGDWDPSLAFVMGGAIAVYFVANRLASRRGAPWLSAKFHLPTRRDLEPSLLVGGGLFGIGWGLAGYCPGPGLTSLATGSVSALVFVLAMASGMLLFESLKRMQARRAESRLAQALQQTTRADA